MAGGGGCEIFLALVPFKGVCVGCTRMLRMLVYVGDGTVSFTHWMVQTPLTSGALVLGWCVLAFYIVGVFCYSSAY